MSSTVAQRPGRLDLELVKGDDAELELTFVDSAGDPVNLSGRAWSLLIVGPGVRLELESTIDSTSAATGVLSIPFAATATAAAAPGTTWALRDTTNGRTLLDGELRGFAPGHAGAPASSRIEQTVTISNSTAAVTVTAAVVGPPGEGGGGGGGGGGGFSQSQIEEFARDAIAAALVAGANITITPNDGSNTITIAGAAGTVDVVSSVASARILGRVSAGSGDSEELTATQVRTLLDVLTSGEVAALVAGLVDAAPGTLDTLNELAAALGDDPNFATTITTALAGKQPLDPDLSAIAALTTMTFGRSLLTAADAAAARDALEVGTAAGIADPGGANDYFLQRKSGAWTNRTVAQVKSDLGVGAPAPIAHFYEDDIYSGLQGLTHASVGGGSAGVAYGANLLYLWRIMVPQDVTVDGLLLMVQVDGGSGALARCGIYAQDSTTAPVGAPLVQSADLNVNVTGGTQVSAPVTATALTAWTPYWGALVTNSATCQIRYMANGSSNTVRVSALDAGQSSTTNHTLRRVAHTFGALPTNPAASFTTAVVDLPGVLWKVQV